MSPYAPDQVQKKLGPAWTNRDRPAAGSFTKRQAEVPRAHTHSARREDPCSRRGRDLAWAAPRGARRRPVADLRHGEPERRSGWKNRDVGSPQTLSEADRRIVAVWAAACAERVLGLFEAEAPGDSRPREAIARTRAFARGELDVAEAIRRRFENAGAARELSAPAAAAAARAAGQATAIPHMGAHALGAAAYAAEAAGCAAPDRPDAVSQEIQWQLGHMSEAVRAALRLLPPVGENRSGPLGPGLLASGLLGTIIRDLQSGLADPDHLLPPDRQAIERTKSRREQPVAAHATNRLA